AVQVEDDHRPRLAERPARCGPLARPQQVGQEQAQAAGAAHGQEGAPRQARAPPIVVTAASVRWITHVVALLGTPFSVTPPRAGVNNTGDHPSPRARRLARGFTAIALRAWRAGSPAGDGDKAPGESPSPGGPYRFSARTATPGPKRLRHPRGAGKL